MYKKKKKKERKKKKKKNKKTNGGVGVYKPGFLFHENAPLKCHFDMYKKKKKTGRW